ncbi:uncharacterized protein F4812DRAFT_430640 [Daldinia caldariorum]|uniref:uncharacterized protein n=1 Tax=Daldinia caldariorum TaxID=326644 RepID=UPI0020088263|nr:uncharacterized protein F4812DRAFT_430640 [Daldinia caldariorum]KAI1467725.1 hypothetical protein F4812DRAFT_430640 [Daldinia caldariorum]
MRELFRRVYKELSRLDIFIPKANMQENDFKPVPVTGQKKLVQINCLSTMLLATLLPILMIKSLPGQRG